ncbi:ATP-binding protein [Singulisphaera sp. PoT]|uniref:ATP-binding protein n=1 Tax=Singulisphaera sp. PoT TaxID=3411797 RepID=UPI003BF4BE6F
MLSTTQSGELVSATTRPLIVLVGSESGLLAEIRSELESSSSWSVENLSGLTELMTSLRKNKPALLVVGDLLGMNESGLSDFAKTLKGVGLRWIQVIDSDEIHDRGATPLDAADDWIHRSRISTELSARVARVLRKAHTQTATTPTRSSNDLRLVPLIVHDLRTPLNVVGLSLPMIEPALPRNNEELQESYRFVEENFRQIERMLALLSDYNRLFEIEVPGSPSEFSPKRMLSEVVENRSFGKNGRPVRIDLLVDDSCPETASLDQVRARQAIHYVLANAVAASSNAKVQLFAHGSPDRWVIEFRVSDPAPSSVTTMALQSRSFERLCGTVGERRGMDLAVAARISELFGGSARIEADKEKGTSVILDWPSKLDTI